MANPTTNYSWQMPTATDLVTDLPADFAVFGQANDTTIKNLNPQTTTGALAYRSATSNVNTALPIGSTGQVLTVASGVPSWATPTLAATGLTLIRRASTSGAVSTGTTFDGVLTSTYQMYKILIEKWTSANDDDDGLFKFRKTAADIGTFYGAAERTIANGTVTLNGVSGASSVILTDQIGDTVRGSISSIEITVRRAPAITFMDNLCWTGVTCGTTGVSFVIGGAESENTLCEGFKLLTTGNMACTVSVYGYATS